MDNFPLKDFNLNFDFDFQHDFTDGENQVIDDILTNPVELETLFETDAPLNDDPTLIFDSAVVLQNFPKNQLATNIGYMERSDQDDFDNFNAGQDPMVAEPNINFDWTTFLESPSIKIQNNISDRPILIDAVQNDWIQINNMICDNDFIYQELNTLDVPQMYANLDHKYSLGELKKIDEGVEYSSLSNGQNDHINSTSLMKKPHLFLLPFHLNKAGIESVQHVASNLKNRSFRLNVMLDKCDDNILLRKRPKQIKQKSNRYLTFKEQMERIKAKEIKLITIDREVPRQKRKQALRFNKEKESVEYAFQSVSSNAFEKIFCNKNNRIDQSNSQNVLKSKKSTTSKRGSNTIKRQFDD